MAVLDVDLDSRVVRRQYDPEGGATNAWILVRRHGMPAHIVASMPVAEMDDSEIADALDRHAAAAAPAQAMTTSNASMPSITVLVCTRRRADSLRRCLQSLLQQDYPAYEVLVVENDSECRLRDVVGEMAAAAAASGGGVRIRHVLEQGRGLSVARNRGVAEANFEHIACIDDDEVADADWLRHIGQRFLQSKVEVVTGYVAPAELRTPSQIAFEASGGHCKGRWLTPALITAKSVNPLFPKPAFGAGANLAFTRSAVRRSGGFVTRLGAGTDFPGGEDSLFLSLHLLRGGAIYYEPRALTWHYHRDTDEGLQDQVESYGLGLGGFYVELVLTHPLLSLYHVARLPARLLRRSRHTAAVDTPPMTLSVRGLAKGALAYLRSRIRAGNVALP